MKKLLTAATTTALALTSAPYVFAATAKVNPCPGGELTGVCKTQDIPTLINRILFYLFVAGAVIAIFFLIWGGIKWITAGGDKTKVQAARDTIIGAIIGLIIVFASYFLISIVLSTFFGINLSSGFTLPQLTQ